MQRFWLWFLGLLVVSALLGVWALPARAGTTFIVNTTADNEDGDGACTLREAIRAANNEVASNDCGDGSDGDDTITFSVSGTIVLSLQLDIVTTSTAEKLTIDGSGQTITISGGNFVAVLVVGAGAELTLKNLTVANGKVQSSVADGGGIYNRGILTIQNSTISGNSAGEYGGGIYNSGTLTIQNGTISGNSSRYGGGGIYNSGTLTIQNSTISNNSADGGGGIANAGTLTVSNSTFSGNSAAYYGGGIFNDSGTLTLNNTIIANSAGGDCVNTGTISSPAQNNLIEGTGTNACGLTNGENGNIIGQDPGLGALTGSPAYFPLNAGSPAIDAGDNTICADQPVNNQSQNGVTRPQDGDGDNNAVCDIGSYEAPAASTPTPTATPQVMRFYSIGAEDGRILESGENTGVGGALSVRGLLRVGDDAARRQYRLVLSFRTAPLPDGAVVVGVRLELRQQGISGGGNPVQGFGGFLVDLREGSFGATDGLEPTDFEAGADKTIGPLIPPVVNGWYTLQLTGGKYQINKVGRTQVRLRFVQDDNDDEMANYVSLSGGEAGAANRPRLVVEYVLP